MERLTKKPTKKLDKYHDHFMSATQFFTTYSPDALVEDLVKYLENEDQDEPVVHKDKYKVTFTITEYDESRKNHVTKIRMRISQVEDQEKYAVQF